MTTFSIDTDGLTYTEDMDSMWASTPLGYYPRIIDAARSLAALRKTFDEAQKDDFDEVTKYHDTIYPLAIVLEIDGEPMGTVRIVDDMYAWVPFKSQEKK